MLGPGLYAGIAITFIISLLLGLASTRLVKTSEDYTVGGRRLGPLLVLGGIVGAFAGGTVTIGTAQMAYRHGLVGIWFTLGAGLACLLLSLFLAVPLRRAKVDTISRVLSNFYGPSVAPWVAVFIAMGMFIQMAVQMLASVPMLGVLFPLPDSQSLFIFFLCTILLVMGGGIMSTSLVGTFKLFLLTLTLLTAGLASWGLPGGMGQIQGDLLSQAHLFPRGTMVEVAGVLSVLMGFISTQSFVQPVFAGKDFFSARLGALLAAVALPCYGLAGVAVGIYMRNGYPGIDPALALPLFMMLHQPPWLGGLGVGTLLLSLVISSGALVLGISTLFSRDIYRLIRPRATDKEILKAARGIVFVSAAAAGLFCYSIRGDLILDWTYLSNAIRGVTVFLPLLGAVYLSQRLPREYGIWAVTLPPLATIAWALFYSGSIHPLYIGLPLSLGFLAVAFLCPGAYGHACRGPISKDMVE